ncbi:hypothetical protein AUP44_24775 [Tistrella mobilis]|uniref:Uncharacterized protein n=1 Tax=Tistrella mobilis TaxID=171437 RepID=A0A162LF51_9PROT|nr:hypothetical protein AUP44_24775 [Tistrella mobilis]
MGFGQVLIFGDNQHCPSEELFGFIAIMCSQPRLHLISLADIDELPARHISVRSDQEIYARASGLFTSDQLRKSRAGGDDGAHRRDAKLGRDDAGRRAIYKVEFQGTTAPR